MKKAILLLLGLFVAGLAAFAVPKEIKDKPIDKVIKVFTISENVSIEAPTFDILDQDVGDIVIDKYLTKDTNDHQTSAALHSEIFRLGISWQYLTNDFLVKNQGKPMQYINDIRHPVSCFHR